MGQGRSAAERRDRERWRAIAAALGRGSLDAGGLAPDFLPAALCEALRCERFCVYRPDLDEGGSWGVRVHGDVNFTQRWMDGYNALLRKATKQFLFDPMHPRDENSNRVVLLDEIHRHGPDERCHVEEVWPEVGLAGLDQIRVLLCEGDTVLAWVGGFRDEPFTESERRSFASIVPELQSCLSLRRRLADADIARGGLAAALEALGAPAFIVCGDGRVAHANAAGVALLERWGRASTSLLRSALTQPGTRAFVQRLDTGGTASHYFLLFRETHAVREARLRCAADAWRLTLREIEVLRLMCEGDSNKEIALKLSCSEVTIERHVTSMLRKARCDSRCRLVSRFWAG